MRANRQLYAPGVDPEEGATGPAARLVRFADIPQPAAYGLVAVLQLSLAAHAASMEKER